MGLAPPPESFELADTIVPMPLVQSSDTLVMIAMSRSPELRAAAMDAEASAGAARLAAAGRIPTPTLTGGYKHENLATGQSLGGFVAGVSLPVPLWDRRGGAVDAARAEAARHDAELEVLRRRTARDVRIAFTAHQALAEQLRLVQPQLGDDAVRARRAAEAAYAEGEIGLLEWLDSVRAYQEAETAYVTLWSEYVARRAALERLTGATLF
jgi:cobalt-zinc-cadmium efflux system outer membrane protein